MHLKHLDSNTFKGAISKNVLAYSIFFLLKYYRDTVAEADHIDIDFENGHNVSATLVITVDKFRELSRQEVHPMLSG